MKANSLKRAALCVALGTCLGVNAPGAFAQDGFGHFVQNGLDQVA